MAYRIVRWSGDNAVSDRLEPAERTSSLAVALKLARWGLEEGAGTVTVYEDGRPFNYRTVDEVNAAAVDAGVAVPR